MKDTISLPGSWELPTSISGRLGRTVGRQRAMEADGQLFLVLHAPPAADENERRGRFFWWSDDSSVRASDHIGNTSLSIATHLEEYETILDDLDKVVADAKMARDYFDALEMLAPLHRSAKNQHQVLQDARKMSPAQSEIIDHRDSAYAIERTAELLLNEAQRLLELAVARKAEEEAAASSRIEASAHRLNILAAVFFPMLTISAVLGIDLETVETVLGRDVRPVADMLLGALLVGGLVLGGVLSLFVTRSNK